MAGQQLATIDPKEFGTFLDGRRTALQRISGKVFDVNKFVTTVVLCVTKSPNLMRCSKQSIMRSCLQAAEMGLQAGSGNGDGYLVPFGNECTFIPGYQGLARLALDSDYIISVESRAVFEGDEFRIEFGLHPNLLHNPGRCRDPKKLTDVYVVWETKHGTRSFDSMTREEVDAIRARSRASSSGPWVTDYAAMAKKTVIRRAAKLWPKSKAFEKALALENAHDTGDYSLTEFEMPEAQPEPVQKAASQERVATGRKAMRREPNQAEETAPATPAESPKPVANGLGACPACGEFGDCNCPIEARDAALKAREEADKEHGSIFDTE